MDAYKNALEYIMDKAIWKAKEAAEDDCCHTCGEWIDIAVDAQEILKHLHDQH